MAAPAVVLQDGLLEPLRATRRRHAASRRPDDSGAPLVPNGRAIGHGAIRAQVRRVVGSRGSQGDRPRQGRAAVRARDAGAGAGQCGCGGGSLASRRRRFTQPLDRGAEHRHQRIVILQGIASRGNRDVGERVSGGWFSVGELESLTDLVACGGEDAPAVWVRFGRPERSQQTKYVTGGLGGERHASRWPGAPTGVNGMLRMSCRRLDG